MRQTAIQRIVCIDSSASTDPVQRSYLPDLRKVVQEAATRRNRLYADTCGSNATGHVDWSIRRDFNSRYKGALAQIKVDSQAEDVIQDLETLIETPSVSRGTSLGEILAVMGRQCGQAGGDCGIYLFTDGDWMDQWIKVNNGVSEKERINYLQRYLPLLRGLAGSQVNFIGVGFGTSIGEVHLAEAHEVARELVQGAGGKMGAWTVSL